VESRTIVARAISLELSSQLVHTLWYLRQPKAAYLLAQFGFTSFEVFAAADLEVVLSAGECVQGVLRQHGHKGGLKGALQQPRDLSILRSLAERARISLALLQTLAHPKQLAAGLISWEGKRRRSVDVGDGLMCQICLQLNVVPKVKADGALLLLSLPGVSAGGRVAMPDPRRKSEDR
jgi:hypothetical protein